MWMNEPIYSVYSFSIKKFLWIFPYFSYYDIFEDSFIFHTHTHMHAKHTHLFTHTHALLLFPPILSLSHSPKQKVWKRQARLMSYFIWRDLMVVSRSSERQFQTTITIMLRDCCSDEVKEKMPLLEKNGQIYWTKISEERLIGRGVLGSTSPTCLRKAFTRVDPKSTKRRSSCQSLLAFGIKA